LNFPENDPGKGDVRRCPGRGQLWRLLGF
jgi:hypothetical protein